VNPDPSLQSDFAFSHQPASMISIRILPLISLGVTFLPSAPAPATIAAIPFVRPNANTTRAGVLQHGVLIVSLEARRSL
jgi:hypothetical protein